MNEYVIYAIIAVGIFTAYMAIVNIFRADRMKKRVHSAGGGAYPLGMGEEEEAPPMTAMLCENLVKLTGVEPQLQKDVTLQLGQAGIQSPHAVWYYLFFKRFIQPLLLVLGGFFFLKMLLSTQMTGMSRLLTLLIAMIFLVIGMFGAKLYVTNKKQRRQGILLHSFPEVLDLLLVCIEAGLGLDAALSRVSNELRESHPVITSELDRTRLELTIMADRVQALQNLGDRTEIVPFKSLVSALIQTEKFGTSLVDTLRVLSDDQRATRLLAAENRAARLPVLITVPIILCIFLPFFLVIILGPPIVRVIEQGGIFGKATPK